MKWFKRVASLFITMAILLGSLTFAVDEMLTFDNDELRDRYQSLTFQLRCPKCQNQNVADSNAPISEDIRLKTYEMLHLGYSDQEIIDFMVDRYTEFVIYKPQMSLVTIWLWIVPGVILALGFIFLLRLTRRPQSSSELTLSNEENERLQALLKDKD